MKNKKKFNLLIIISFIILVISIIVYATIEIYKYINTQSNRTAIFANIKMEENKNTIWINTFQLAWNELSEYLIGGKNIEFEGETPLLADKLNEKHFTKDMINEKDYYIKVGSTSAELKKNILMDVENKFGYSPDGILNDINFNTSIPDNYLTIYAMLNKKFTFLEPFVKLVPNSFKNSEKFYHYFGIQDGALDILDNNLNVLFYNNENEFAVNLKTKEKEEIILYRTDCTDDFENLYNNMLENTKRYRGNSKFSKIDCLEIPEISMKTNIHYEELCKRIIKGTPWEISEAIQNVNFNMNQAGGNLKSEIIVNAVTDGISIGKGESRKFIFDDTFVIFMKEREADLPYMYLYVDNTEILNEV